MATVREAPAAAPGAMLAGLPRGVSALAPMQDVTTLPFMRIIGEYGAPDLFFTEYFRVHAHSRLEPHILASITGHGTGRPVFAQLIGEDLEQIERTVGELLAHPVAGIDINLGCPAPKVYRKNVGGGLLRDPGHTGRIFGLLRGLTAGRCPFTVKMRIGFDGDDTFEDILALCAEHRADLVSLHARTVREMYRGEPHYAYIARAAAALPCPVLANGNLTSARKALRVMEETGAHGIMAGRHAIRNPWIFRQIREAHAGGPVFQPTLGDVRGYIERLRGVADRPHRPPRHSAGYLKKFLNFVALGVDPDGSFLKEMRRARELDTLLRVCDLHLLGPNAGKPFADEPYPGLTARPSRERDGEAEPRACAL